MFNPLNRATSSKDAQEKAHTDEHKTSTLFAAAEFAAQTGAPQMLRKTIKKVTFQGGTLSGDQRDIARLTPEEVRELVLAHYGDDIEEIHVVTARPGEDLRALTPEQLLARAKEH